MNTRRVVITGMGVVTPLGCDLEVFWRNLLAGKCGIGPITRFDATQFDSQIGGEIKDFKPDEFLPSKDIRRTDRFVHYAVAATKKAIADSQLDLAKQDLNRVGVLVGSGIGGMETIENQSYTLFNKGPGRVSPFMIPMLIIDMASGYISMLIGAKGPNLSVVSACATANHAIGEAARAIIHDDADVMIAGGSEAAITPLGYAGFCAMRAMSTRNNDPLHASRPFDNTRDGFVMSEGAGVCILESAEHARRRGARIYAEIAGYGISGDAYHMSAPAPEGEGAQRAMHMALKHAKLNPDQIQHINAHATSTPLGDRCEVAAIKNVFGHHARKIAVSATKSMTGHLLGASGAVETAACLLAMRDGIVPPTINYQFPDPECDLDCVPNQARELKITACLNNSFGFGGHNASLVFRKYE